MTDFEWLDSGPNGSEGHYSMHSKNPHFATPLYTTEYVLTAVHEECKEDLAVKTRSSGLKFRVISTGDQLEWIVSCFPVNYSFFETFP